MKTREQVIRTNARKREFRWTARGAIKAILVTILVIILLIAAICGMFYAVHNSKTKTEITVLDINKVYDMYDVDGIETNISVTKGVNSKHTIVSIADIGDNTFSLYANMIFEEVRDDVTVVNIDRPGYGMSDDTTDERTVDNIIKHYRASLDEVGIDEPIILLTYGFGSVYATEWANQYPDEIKAIITINGTILTENNDEIEAYEMTKLDYLLALGNKIGVQRIFYKNWFNDMHRELSNDVEKCVQVLNMHSAKTFAQYSEMVLKEENFKTVLNNMEANNIPVFYIATENTLETDADVSNYVEYMNALSIAKEEAPFYNGGGGASYDEFIENTIAECNKYQEEVLEPFIETYNNATIIKIPGYGKIYQQKAIAMDNFAKDFVKWLNGDIAMMNSRYENEFPKQEVTVPEETEPETPEASEETNPAE